MSAGATSPVVAQPGASAEAHVLIDGPAALSKAPLSSWRVALKPSLRTMTVALRVRPPKPLLEVYENLSARHADLSKLMKLHGEGGFGSGFVVVHQGPDEDSSLRLFVVTNQHVVGLAEEAEVEFLEQQESYSGTVVYVDETFDLAILEVAWKSSESSIPPIEEGFGFAEHAPRDQDVVVAVGYPGIAGEPSYQVTRGYVSNEKVFIPIDGSPSAHVQHTASIDSGSSGGPLLDEAGKVLGINTLKVRDREGVGLAVPAPDVVAALTHVAVHSAEAASRSQDETQTACLALLKHVESEGVQAIERGLSVRLVARYGVDSLSSLPDDSTNWAQAFYFNPEEVFLSALAHRMKKALNVEGIVGSCETDEKGTSIHLGTRVYPLTFSVEQSRLKLSEIELPKTSTVSFLQTKQTRKKKWSPSLR